MGGAFVSPRAKRELDLIASSLSTNHVFQVESFDALDAITKNLQDKIFSIEGTDVNLQVKIKFTFSVDKY